MSTEAEHAG